MKILVFIEQRSAAQIIMSDFAEAFKKIGNDVKFVDIREFFDRYSKEKNEDIKSRKFNEFFQALRDFDPDFIFSYGREVFEFVFPVKSDKIQNNISLAEYLGRPIIMVFFDDPLNAPDGKRSLEPAAVIKSPMCMVYCWDKSYVKELNGIGYGNVKYLPLAVNPVRFYPEQLDRESEYLKEKITFVGGPSDERISLLNKIEQNNLEIYGYEKNEWQDGLRSKEFYIKPILRFQELRRIYSSSMINLNVTLSHGKNSANMRVFEILACKGFLITDHKKELNNLLSIDRDLVTFRDAEDLNLKIKYFIDRPDERERIAREGFESVLKKHKYIDRAMEILADCKIFLPLSKIYLQAVQSFYQGDYDKSIAKCYEIIKAKCEFVDIEFAHSLIQMSMSEKTEAKRTDGSLDS